MTALSRIRSLVRNLLHRERVERALDAELQSFVDALVAEKVRAGMAPGAARREALIETGGVEHVKEEVRDQRQGAWLEVLAQDARYGLRSLRNSPAFTGAAALALALGIGTTTAIVSVVDHVLLRPLAYEDANRLVVLSHGDGGTTVAPANFLDWRSSARAFSHMAAAEYWTPNLAGGDSPEAVNALHLSADMIPMLGVRPQLGRVFTADEDRPGGERVAVIGYGLWQRRFASDPNVLGKQVLLDGVPYAIIGVMPREFMFAPFWATHAELWAPLALGARAGDRSGASLRVFARLRPGVSIDQARSDIAAVARRLDAVNPGSNRGVTATPLMDLVVGDARTPLLMLLVAVACVLLISCANVAHMLLARAAARRKEIAVRTALGAGRRRIVRQLLTESVLLAGIGGVGGILLAAWMVRALVALSPAFIPRIATVAIDGRVLGLSLAITMLTGIVFGLVPALRASAVDVAQAFKDGDRGSTSGRRRARLRSVLVASEIALALVLLVGAGLMMRSFAALRRVDPGFDPRGVVTMTLSLTGTREAAPGVRTAFYREVKQRIERLPNVASVGMINHVPIGGDNWGMPFAVEGRPVPKPGEFPRATYRVVLPGYFAAMRVTLRAGRDFTDADQLDAPRVVVINDAMARQFWPAGDAVGKRVRFGDSTWVTVVGVVHNVVTADIASAPEPELYVPYLQESGYLSDMGAHHTFFSIVARAACVRAESCDGAAIAPSIRGVVRSLDRNVAVSQVQTMSQLLDSVTANTRFYLLLLGAFASIALVLAALGIYGVVHYTVTQRTQEIGIRVALGADTRRVVGLIVQQGLAITLIGVGAGAVVAFALTRLMSTLLYGVGASDVWTFAATALLLIGVATVASALPARRATRIDPLRALRAE